jgi:hypothetical protein
VVVTYLTSLRTLELRRRQLSLGILYQGQRALFNHHMTIMTVSIKNSNKMLMHMLPMKKKHVRMKPWESILITKWLRI